MEQKIIIKRTIITLLMVCFIGIIIYSIMRKKTEPIYLYKIVTQETFNKSLGKEKLELPDFDKTFIHFATQEQIEKVVDKFFANEKNIYILKIETKLLPGRLLKEKNPGGQTEYYHLYDGFIPQSAIISQEMIIQAPQQEPIASAVQ